MSNILETKEKNGKIKSKPTEHSISIGGMTYVIVSHFSDTSTDTAKEKIERLIKRDVSAS